MQLNYTALMLSIIATLPCSIQSKINKQHRAQACMQQRAQACMQLSARGDALGRVTEFKDTLNHIYTVYPKGVLSVHDFRTDDWLNIPQKLSCKKIAPYTDDTGMALLVLRELTTAHKEKLNLDKTMELLAQAFINDLDNPLGWHAPFRAPGNACLAGVKKLKAKTVTDKKETKWWDVHAQNAGGCGAVMRAHPFGIVFAHDPEKAASYAADHSKLTHGHPMSRAASAGLASGIAHLIQGDNTTTVANAMIAAARKYDEITATKLEQAIAYAQQARTIITKQKITDVTGLHNALSTHGNDLRTLHEKVFTTFEGWRADDALAAALYTFILFPTEHKMAIYTGVHTPGDSDSIACLAGALVGAYTGSSGTWDWSVEGQTLLATLAKQAVH